MRCCRLRPVVSQRPLSQTACLPPPKSTKGSGHNSTNSRWHCATVVGPSVTAAIGRGNRFNQKSVGSESASPQATFQYLRSPAIGSTFLKCRHLAAQILDPGHQSTPPLYMLRRGEFARLNELVAIRPGLQLFYGEA